MLDQLTDKDTLEFGRNLLILLAGVAAAKIVQILVLQITLRFNNWLHTRLDKTLEQYARRPLLFLLVGIATSFALYFTTWRDVWVNRLRAIDHVLIIGCVGWLAIGITLGVASWLEGHYAHMNGRDPLGARRFSTQIRVLTRVVVAGILVLTVIAMALFIPSLRQFGVSLFASAGLAGLVLGVAANSTLSNLIAGIQIAITQPILLGDEVFINGLTGRVEEIRASYLVIKLEDARRMIIPFNWFMSNPIVNATYEGGGVFGTLRCDAPLATDILRLRAALQELVKTSPAWDGKTCDLIVGDMKANSVPLSVKLGAHNSSELAGLQSLVQQKLLQPLAQKQAA